MIGFDVFKIMAEECFNFCEQIMITVIVLYKLIFHCDYLGCFNPLAGQCLVFCIQTDLYHCSFLTFAHWFWEIY